MCDGTYAVLYVDLMMQVQYAYLLFYVQFGPAKKCPQFSHSCKKSVRYYFRMLRTSYLQYSFF